MTNFSNTKIELVQMSTCPNCGANVAAYEINYDLINGGGYCEECKAGYINTTIIQTFNVDEAIRFIEDRPDRFDRYISFFEPIVGRKKRTAALKAVAESDEREKLSRLFLGCILENDAEEYFRFVERIYFEDRIFLKYGIKKKRATPKRSS